MVAGNWYNYDGIPLQYGTQKAVPDLGGNYLVYGETREIEQLIPLVNMQYGVIGSMPVVTGAPTTFSGTGTAQQAGIYSLTTLFPLAQATPVTTVTSSQYSFSVPQIFVEQVEVETIIAAAGGTSLKVGLAVTTPGVTTNSTFTLATDSTFSSNGNQFINGLVTADMVQGAKVIFNGVGGQFISPTTGTPTAITTGGVWVGQWVPLISNAITPLPQAAWISAIATGSFTAGLVKIRIKYVQFGDINY